MKKGAGDDPFAEDAGSNESKDAETEPSGTESGNEEATPVKTEQSAEAESVEDPAAGGASAERSASERSASERAAANGGASATHRGRTIQIPYKFRRDGVQDDRSRVPLFLQSETKTAERDALREFEDRFDDDVSLTDLREALVMVGLRHMDEVEVQLEEWGYGMTFE